MKAVIAVAACAVMLLMIPAALIDMVIKDPTSVPEDVLEAIAPGASAGLLSDAEWVCPVTYIRISSPYGYRIHPMSGAWALHSGVDLSAPMGTPIYATRAGTVTSAAYNSSGGNFVIINHGDGFDSRYLHMTYYIVSPGQEVAQGQLIGYVGSTGDSTGSHLHFMICYNGQSTDPCQLVYLPEDGAQALSGTPTEPEETEPGETEIGSE